MGAIPRFSIIIPVKEINDYVRETVPYIQALDSDNWELIIIPNGPDQNEWELDQRISLNSSGRVGPADKRDQAAQSARGEVLVFLDDSWHGRVGRMRCQIYESHYQKSGNASRCRESPKKQSKVLYLNFQPIIIF